MTLLEAIKLADKKQKYLGENVKVYIYRHDWNNKLVDTVDFTWALARTPIEKSYPTIFRRTSIIFRPNKDDIISDDWKLFTYYLDDLKENEEVKPESISISREAFVNSIEQVTKVKSCLNILNERVKNVENVFETIYGINFNCFKENANILIDKETRMLYLFVAIFSNYSKEINERLNKIESELNNLNSDEKTE